VTVRVGKKLLMKSTIFAIALVLLAAGAHAQAQCKATEKGTIDSNGRSACVTHTVGPTDLTVQGAAISATTLYAVPSTDVGLYGVCYSAKLTRAATTSSTLGGATGFQVIYTDATDSVVVTTAAGPTSTLNTTQAQVSGCIVVHAKASTNIQYAFGYTSSGATTMQYKISARVFPLN
jgi:hypothetical protein